MAYRTQRDFRRQASVITGLSIYHCETHTVTAFTTEEWAGGNVHVKRVVKPNHCERLAYHESFVVGPRGGIKELYSSFY